MQHGWNGTTACECLQRRKLSENYEHCIKHSLWARQGLHVNCLYNNLVTCARNSAVQWLLRTSGRRETERDREKKQHPPLAHPPLLGTNPVRWRGMRVAVSPPAYRDLTHRISVFVFSRTSRMFWVYRFRKTQGVVNVSGGAHVLLRRWDGGESVQGSLSIRGPKPRPPPPLRLELTERFISSHPSLIEDRPTVPHSKDLQPQ